MPLDNAKAKGYIAFFREDFRNERNSIGYTEDCGGVWNLTNRKDGEVGLALYICYPAGALSHHESDDHKKRVSNAYNYQLRRPDWAICCCYPLLSPYSISCLFAPCT